MDDRLSRLERRVAELRQSLGVVEKRVRALEEARDPPRGETARFMEPSIAATNYQAGEVPASNVAPGISLVGRTILVLGGAYLLRALTDRGLVPQPLGIALGFIYAISWIVLADRAGAAGKNLSAGFHGAAAASIAYPLIWEALTRFELVTPLGGVAGLVLTSGLSIAVSWRWGLRLMAWVTVSTAIPTALLFSVSTRQLAPFVAFLVSLAVVSLWQAYRMDWPVIHWVTAAVADLAVLIMTLGVVIERSNASPTMVVTIQLGMFAAFVGTFLVRVIVSRREVGLFESIQAAVVLLLGFAAPLSALGSGLGEGLVGVAGVGLAIFCYVVSFRAILPLREHGRNFFFVTSLGLLLVLLSTGGLLRDPTFLWAVLALVGCYLGSRWMKTTLSLHGAVYLVAAAWSAGLVTQGAFALVATADVAWPRISGEVLFILTVAAVCSWFPVVGETSFAFRKVLPKLMQLVTLAWSGCGVILTAVVPPLAGWPGEGADPAVLAEVRTMVLAAAAMLLGWAGRFERFREASSLVYPVLLLGGIKMVVEDLPRGRPDTLFVAFLAYGGALILAPRVSRGFS